MLTAPSRNWSIFQQIFADHWEAFQHAHPRYQTPYYDGLVAMSCKSSLCLRCAKVHVANGVSQVSQVLHEGVIYRHIILTVPAMFRTTFYQNAA